jgi:hypothetical protein
MSGRKQKDTRGKTLGGKLAEARAKAQAEVNARLAALGMSQPVKVDAKNTIVDGHARAAVAAPVIRNPAADFPTLDGELEAQRHATQFLRSRPEATGCRAQGGGVWYSFGVEVGEDGKRFAVRRTDFLAGV